MVNKGDNNYDIKVNLRSAVRKLLTVIVLLIFSTMMIRAQDNRGYRTSVRKSSERAIARKEARVREPRSVRKAKKKQEANQEKLKKEYEAFVEEGRKRAYEIQSPEVKERMKANKKETRRRYKEKKKINSANTTKPRKKY